MRRATIKRTGKPWPYDSEASVELSGGDRGTRETLAAMAELVRDGARRPEIRSVARRVMTSGSRTPIHLQAVRLFHYLRRAVEFEKDPPGVELIRHPAQLLAEIRRTGVARGDCDDLAILGATMLRAMNIPAAFIVIGRDPWKDMEHVYFAARVVGRWIALDPQEVDRPGREREHARRWMYPIL